EAGVGGIGVPADQVLRRRDREVGLWRPEGEPLEVDEQDLAVRSLDQVALVRVAMERGGRQRQLQSLIVPPPFLESAGEECPVWPCQRCGSGDAARGAVEDVELGQQ